MSGHFSGVLPKDTSLIKADWYEVAQGSPSSAYPLNWRAVDGGANENSIITDTLPSGAQGLIWKCTPSGNGNADGGYNAGGGRVAIDPTKTYRLSVWVKRNINMDGATSLGLQCYNSAGSNVGALDAALAGGTPNTNFYFFEGDPATVDEWYLAVSYIHPVTSTAKPLIGGLYKYGDLSRKSSTNRDARFVAGTAFLEKRDYLLYANAPAGSSQYITQPRIDLVDGTEPSLDKLLGVNESVSQVFTPAYNPLWSDHSAALHPLRVVLEEGIVTINGVIKNTFATATNSAICTLPEAYRPAATIQFLTNTTGLGQGQIDIAATGVMTFVSGNAGQARINISYPAALALAGEHRM